MLQFTITAQTCSLSSFPLCANCRQLFVSTNSHIELGDYAGLDLFLMIKKSFSQSSSRLVWEMFSCGYQSKLSTSAKWLKDKQCWRKMCWQRWLSKILLFNSISNSFPSSYLAWFPHIYFAHLCPVFDISFNSDRKASDVVDSKLCLITE